MIDVRNSGSILIVTLSGEIDIASAPDLTAALTAAVSGDWRVVAVACDQLEFIDIVGARPLCVARREAEACGIKFYLLRPSPRIMRVLDLFDLASAVVAGKPSSAAILDNGGRPPSGLVDLSASAILSRAGRPYLELPSPDQRSGLGAVRGC
ncbi:MAG TPA: STAS domain-containing protein [Mycobacteriales bacterium]|jgi:anti-sigma B factor antagonist|nr:STAS domain-containing protein [Mycobacteriales bacterium]